MGKVSTLSHFQLEPNCEDYYFFGSSSCRLLQGLDSILTDSVETMELDESFVEPDTVNSLVSLWFLCFISTIADNSKLWHAPSIKSNQF